MDILQEVAIKVLVLGHSTEPPPPFLELFKNSLEPGLPYHFVHLRGSPSALIRFNNPGDESFVVYQRPFDNFPTVQAKLHPYFAILNVAQWVLEHREKKTPVNPPEFLQPHLDLCVVIYKQWLTLRPAPKGDPKTALPLIPASVGKSESSPARPPTANTRRAKRARDLLDDEDEALATNNSRSQVKGKTSVSKA